jgi:hypothetical protein
VTLPRAFDLRRANCCSWQSGVDRSSKGREADRLQSLLPRLQTRYEQVANKEEYATWINQYDPLKSRRDALDTEIKNVYAAAVAKLVPLLHQLAPLNNDISQWCRSKPSGHLHDGDKRWLSAIPTPHDLKLPNPDKPTVNLWPHLAATLLSMARAGDGVAWLPRTLAEDDISSGLLVEAGDPGLAIPI